MRTIDRELFESVLTYRTEDIVRLIEKGANLNAKDRYGRTIFMHLAQKGKLTMDIMRFLHGLGADINARNDYGRTLLIYMAGNGYLTTITAQCLKGLGADFRTSDRNGMTVPMCAARGGYLSPELAMCLKTFGADLHAVNSYGRTAIMYLGLYGHLTGAIAKCLHDFNVDFNAKSISGCTAGTLAAQYGKTDSFVEWARYASRERIDEALTFLRYPDLRAEIETRLFPGRECNIQKPEPKVIPVPANSPDPVIMSFAGRMARRDKAESGMSESDKNSECSNNKKTGGENEKKPRPTSREPGKAIAEKLTSMNMYSVADLKKASRAAIFARGSIRETLLRFIFPEDTGHISFSERSKIFTDAGNIMRNDEMARIFLGVEETPSDNDVCTSENTAEYNAQLGF